jgi:hypothetical protein
VLSKPSSYTLSRQQVETAWEYAYRFFYEYPRPFPWRLVGMWQDYKAHPLTEILGPAGMRVYGATFNYLLGATIDWKTVSNGHNHPQHEEGHHAAPVHAETSEASPPSLPANEARPSASTFAEGA